MLQKLSTDAPTSSMTDVCSVLFYYFHKAEDTDDLFFRVALWYVYRTRKKHCVVPSKDEVRMGVTAYIARFRENGSVPHYMCVAYERVMAQYSSIDKNSSRR